MQLNELKSVPGSKHRRMRVGRGIGSGKGKTSGRGGKGQTARTGVRINGFEGGQTPIHRRLPKRGFKNHTRKIYAVINLGSLQKAIDAGKLDAKQPIALDQLKQAGLARKSDIDIKLLAKGALTAKITLSVNLVSKAAQAAIEKVGGTVTLPAAKVAKEPKAKADKQPKPKNK